MWIFSTLIIWEIRLQSLNLSWGINFVPPSLPLPTLIFSYLQALIHGFLWWWSCSWLIFSLKWRLQSPFLLLHFASMIFKKQRNSSLKKIQGLQAPHGATSPCHIHVVQFFLIPSHNRCSRMSLSICCLPFKQFIQGQKNFHPHPVNFFRKQIPRTTPCLPHT